MKMNDCSRQKTDEIRRLTGLIARMQDVPPPTGLTQEVMRRIAPKRPTLWQRLRIRLSCPLTVIDIRPLPTAAAAVLLIGFILVIKAFWVSPAGYPPSAANGGSRDQMVSFTLDWPGAEKVAVIGSFNSWRSEHYLMQRNPSDGSWELTIRLQPGRYAYAFVIDDKQIIADPRSLWEQDDGFGTRNSIITIEDRNSHENRI